MRISQSGPVAVSPVAIGAQPEAGKAEKADPKGKSPRRDSVEISDSGRAMDARSETPITPARVAEIRARILDGSYDTVEVLGTIANRILDRGDA